MAFKDLGAVADEDKIQITSPLQPQGEEPIAALLGKIPGIGAFLKRVQQQTSPKGVMGPGVLAQMGAAATGSTPQAVYDATIGPTRMAAGTAAGLALPGPTLLARLLGGAVIPMVEHAIEQPGQNAAGFIGKGLAGAGLQGAAEGLGNVVRQIPMQRAASRARTAATQAQEAQVTREADRLAQHEARVKVADAELVTAKGLHAEELARVTMDEAKQAIPAWRDIPSTIPGLYTAVLGKGQDLLSKEYGQAMIRAKNVARGEDLLLPLEDIRRLRIPTKSLGNRPDMAPGEPITHGVVDAADAIEAITKQKGGKADWGLYRRTVEALGDLGVDPEARSVYKTGQGIIEAIDKTGALHAEKGQSILDTEKLFEAMHKVKDVNILRNRDMGDWDTSPIVKASKAPPQRAETPKPEPEAPILSPDELGEVAGPNLGTRGQRMKVGGGLGFLSGLLTGTGAGHYYSPPAVTGALIGGALPNQWITKAPGTEPLIELFKRLQTLGAGGLREGLTQTSLTPEQEAEIQAGIAARTEQDPRLQLDVSSQ